MARDTSQRIRDLGRSSRAGSLPPSLQPDDGADEAVDILSFVMMALLGLLAVVLLAVFFGVRRVETALETDAQAVLAASGFDNVRAAASGRDLTLTGTVPAEDLIAAAGAVVETVDGVGAVRVDLQVVLPRTEVELDVVGDPLVISWTGAGVTVSGDVSDDATRTALLDFLRTSFGKDPDGSGLAVLDGLADERDWLTDALQAVAAAADVISTGELTVNPSAGVVILSAELENRQERRELRDEAETLLAASGLSFVSGLTVKDAPPPPRREQVIELQENLDDLIAGKVVEFELNSDVITPEGRRLLDELLEALLRFPDVPVEIGGHADSQGSADENLDLSHRRAEAVLDYLVANGDNADRYIVVGYGETRPIADNSTAEGRARNRRIEFTALEE